MNNFDPDAIVTNTYVAALAGALLGLKAVPGGTIKDRLANLLFGLLMAVYVGPALVDYLHITSRNVSACIVFSVGAAGLVAFGALVEGIKQTQFGTIISGWLSRNPNKGV